MRLKDVILANKDITDQGKWQRTKMTTGAFPLSRSKGRSYRLRAAYEWRVIRFQALGKDFRLLIAFNLEKEQYFAVLGLDDGRDTRVLASYEFHGTHPGWHVTAACGPIEDIPSGIRVGPWQRRIPEARTKHRRITFGVTKENAVEVAGKFFRLYRHSETLL